MSSLLGNYVHYYWSNYKRYGTYRRASHWISQDREQGTQENDFDTNIFNAHQQSLETRIENLRFQGDLQQLSTQYNNKVREQAKVISELKKNNNAQFVGLVSAIVSSLGDSYEKQLDKIVESIDWNEAKETFTYRGVGTTTSTSSPPAYSYKVIGDKRASSQPRIDYCEKQFIPYIQEVTGDSNHQDIQKLREWVTILKENLRTYKSQEEVLKRIKKNKQGDQSLRDLPADLAREIDNNINDIRFYYTNAINIQTAIQAAFAEFIGNTLEQDLNSITAEEIVKALDVGKRETGTVMNGSQVTIKMNTDTVKNWFKQQGYSKRTMNALSAQVTSGKDKVVTDFYATLGGSTSQKTDIEANLEGTELRISMKNTNLMARSSEDNLEKEYAIPHVSLQNSVLALYLTALQKESPQTNLGNHYLNILAEHDVVDSTYHSMRQQANEALTLYILYSALTGQGQLRKQGFANVFAVYDKSNYSVNGVPYQRVKFFDMADILTDFSSSGYNVLQPAIKDISFNNDWGETSTDRITRLLLEARTKAISATLSTEMLRNMYAARA